MRTIGKPCHPRRGDQSIHASMRPLKVVVVDEQADAPLPGPAVAQHSGLHALAPQRPPESLDLAERLRMPRRGDDLPDATLFQLAAEGALAAPCTITSLSGPSPSKDLNGW